MQILNMSMKEDEKIILSLAFNSVVVFFFFFSCGYVHKTAPNSARINPL